MTEFTYFFRISLRFEEISNSFYQKSIRVSNRALLYLCTNYQVLINILMASHVLDQVEVKEGILKVKKNVYKH